jgi:glycosyltransferase involved in cell wall biosynthesis
MTKIKVAILGSRGIPNHYGGFGQLAEYLSVGLVNRGFDVWVYNVHDHPYQDKEWRGVKIIHSYDAEKKIGTAGQFIYDLNCILDARTRKFDVIIQLGYTSSTIWWWLMPSSAKVATNMDGLEWKRSKYSGPVKQFLKLAEWLGVKTSDLLIADSLGIQEYLRKKYAKESTFIAYGAELFNTDEPKHLSEFGLHPFKYDLLIARMEPENHVREIMESHAQNEVNRILVVVGNTTTALGTQLLEKYKNDERFLFTQGIYNIEKLNHLRQFCYLYYHGHSVGGTNPSLLEAMAAGAPICAHNNEFNKSVLGKNAIYFNSTNDLVACSRKFNRQQAEPWIIANREIIEQYYSWDRIINDYQAAIESLVVK